jgi:hypothetical protein
MSATDPPRHALSEAVATLLPRPAETLFLRGCLDRGEAGKRALDAWLSQQSDPIAALTRAPIRWLLPLVFHACVHHRVSAASSLVTVLKTAALREELRIQSYRAIRRRVLQALAAANLHPIVLKGAALSELVYPNAALRHTHDVELLIPASEWDRLDTALAPLGFSAAASSPGASRRELTHPSGLPLVLHRRLFRLAFYDAAQDAVRMRTEPATLDGIAVHVLSPADMLVHVCGDALHSSSLGSRRWIVDAWFLVHRRADLDWDAVAQMASARHMALPLALTLDYLREQLGAPVPQTICARLTTLAAQDPSVGPELGLHAARVAAGGFWQLMRRTRTISGRAAVLRHLLLPSVGVLSWATQPRSPRLRAMHAQVFRVARYVRRRFTSAVPAAVAPD